MGIILGLLFVPREFDNVFPLARPWEGVSVLLFAPTIHLYLLFEPLFVGEIAPNTFVPLRWVRSALVLTIPLAGLTYIASRRRAALWYLGVLSCLLIASGVVSTTLDAEQM